MDVLLKAPRRSSPELLDERFQTEAEARHEVEQLLALDGEA
jgi:hypothetical protein